MSNPDLLRRFIAAEMALFMEQAKDVDIIITTALIPGKPAPKLITKDMVAAMRQGSVIVDMASEAGGNCEVTKPGQLYVHDGVTIIGLYSYLVAVLPIMLIRVQVTRTCRRVFQPRVRHCIRTTLSNSSSR